MVFGVLISLFVLLLPAMGVPAALFMVLQGGVSLIHVALFAVGFLVTGLGVTIGYHRLLTHRSFETHGIFKFLLLVFGSMAVQGSALDWAANHRLHHAHSDQPGDPHSPTQGLVHSHCGWLLGFAGSSGLRTRTARPDALERWVTNTFLLWALVGYVVPFVVAGWEGLVWGGLLRQFAVSNVTFAVNSVCHRWGSRPFRTRDESRNNWVVAILGLGEGWHNNHHAFPSSAIHGLRTWEFDLSGQVIRFLEIARVAWNVKRPDQSHIQAQLAVATAT
jgi:stearoyl-CoA desaturase (delta-9 desaturase)